MSGIRLALKTSKPITSAVAGLVVFVILLSNARFSVLSSIFHSMPVVLVTMMAFVVNDIYDYEKDVRGNLDKPIAKGLLSKKTATLYAMVIACSATITELLLNGYSSLIVFLAALFGALVYSPLSTKVPTAKGFATAALSLMPVIYASSIANISVPYYIFFSIALFIIGREILLDTKHLVGDLASGIRTISSYMGLNISRIVAWSLMFAGVVYFFLNLTSVYAVALSSAGLFCLMLALILDIRNRVKHGGITILTMIFTLLAIPFAI